MVTLSHPRLSLKRRASLILVVVFIGVLLLPAVDSFFGIDHAPPTNENRLPAEFPKLEPGMAGLQKYLVGIEAYFKDHFGYRKRLICWNNKMKWLLFRDRSASNVIVGEDGWLFFLGAQMIEHYRGTLQFKPQDLLAWQALLEKRRDWLALQGIKYIFVVAPDKHSIYDEYLPAWLSKARPETKLDQFCKHMRAHSSVEILDLRSALRNAKKMSPAYLKTDTHWNYFGAFVAYQELVKALSKQLTALEPLSLDSFERDVAVADAGDLANGLAAGIVENNAIDFKPKQGLPMLTIALAPKDRPKEPEFSSNAESKGSVIVFQDSFGRYWEPFLGYNFNKVVYLWQNEMDAKWIKQEKPVVVVSEMVERTFNIEDPKKLMINEALK